MGAMIGIDLGTTNSVAAIVDRDGCRILQNKENEQQTRSAVTYYKGDFLVGSPAFRRWLQDPKNTIISVKRIIGRGFDDPVVAIARANYQYVIIPPHDGTHDSLRVVISDQELSPVDVSALILQKIKVDAEFVLGVPVTHAVITVPAYFSEKQKFATRQAGLKAGLKVMKIIDEPTAAAVAYGISAGENEARTLLVYDLGGGTFDISVIMMYAGTYATLNLEGDMWLGGDNFDQLIIDQIIRQLKDELGFDPAKNARFMTFLRLEAQKAKETLSSARLAQIFISGQLSGPNGELVDVDTEITREQFETLARPLVDKSVEMVRKAVANANLELADIDFVIMAGNATGIPMVQKAMEDLFGKERILRKLHPKFAVAMGAAITASMLKGISCPYCNALNESLDAAECSQCHKPLDREEVRLCPRCGSENDLTASCCQKCGCFFVKGGEMYGTAPFSYGIQTAGDVYYVFIQKNDHYPTEPDQIQTQSFKTSRINQRIIQIPVYGGDHLESASLNEKQGEAMAILPPWLPAGTTVKVRLWLDQDGSFDLKAYLEDGTDLHPSILRGQLDQKIIEKMKQVDDLIIQREDKLPVDRKKQIDAKRNEIYEEIQQRQFTEAAAEAEKLEAELQQAPQQANGADLKAMAQNIMGFCAYLIEEYTWLVGADAYQLNLQKDKVQQALAGRSAKNLQEAVSALEKAVDDLLQANQLLNLCIGIETQIAANIRPIDPAQAEVLHREFKEITALLEAKQEAGVQKLNSFTQKLLDALARMPKAKKTYTCKVCGTENPSTAKVCSKCHNNIDLLEGMRSTLSSGWKR